MMGLNSFVNLPAVADVVEINPALLSIKVIKHSVVAHAQLRSGLVAAGARAFQACTHLVHFPLDGVADGCRKRVKCFGECRRPNLQRGGHGPILADAWCIDPPQFRPGIDRAWFLPRRSIQAALQDNRPFPDFFDFRPRQLWNRCFDFFNRAHGK